MIYLDNAAGSYPKPPQVTAALAEAGVRYGANPGRGSYQLARRSEEMCERVRVQLARLINAPQPQQLVFTAGATASLNMAVWGIMCGGGHAICSSMEHNALFRPLAVLADAGRIELTVVDADQWGYLRAEDIEAALRPSTRLIAVSHASNVCGSVQPLAEIGNIARRYCVPLLVDAAQSGGLLPLDVQKMHISLLALAGHKALYGPAGIGALYVEDGLELAPLISGGGAASELRHQPEQYPQRLEAGSLNVCGIAAWGTALQLVEQLGEEQLCRHGLQLCRQLEQSLRSLPGVHLQLCEHEQRPRTPVLSLTMEQLTPQQAAAELDRRGICVRAGYHCAPLAHRTLDTYEDGTLRFSPGWYNTPADIELTAAAMAEIIEKAAGR